MTSRPDVPDRAVAKVTCKDPDWCEKTATKDGYCWQHHPDAVAEREKKRNEKRMAKELAVHRAHVEQFIDGLTDQEIYDVTTFPSGEYYVFRAELKRLIPTPEGKKDAERTST